MELLKISFVIGESELRINGLEPLRGSYYRDRPSYYSTTVLQGQTTVSAVVLMAALGASQKI
jgi:hypothetical protein